MLDDLYYLRERARQAIARGDLDDAANALVSAASQTNIAENDYVGVLRPLEDVLARRGDARSAMTVLWYMLGTDRDGIKRAYARLKDVPPVDRARTLAAANDMTGADREMENAGLVAAAAIYKEKAGDFVAARALWSRLAQVTTGGADAYNAALVQFNLARCAKQCKDARQAHDALVASVRLVEEAADHFESVGQRERAFDCFQVLVQIGRESGMFEDVLEGFVNCIRILREDHLKYFALQYFEDALGAARENKEFSAAATIAREVADYSRALGMGPTSAHYVLQQAELWRDVARQQKERGAPPEIAENALLAAVLAFGEAGQYSRVGKLYEELATMDLEPARTRHYARAAKRYEGVRDEPLDAAPLPAHLKQDNQFPDVWHVDLLEWEQQGSAAEACAEILLDKQWPDMIRRKAMLARLTAFAVEARPEDASQAATASRVRLCEQLAQLGLYGVLSPLEKLFARPERQVRAAVLSAMQVLFFKRSFNTVRLGLRDADSAVVEQAERATEALTFPHAFDPLSRIVREHARASTRAAALRALAKVDTVEAAEFLLGMIEHGGPQDRTATLEGLKRSRATRFIELARASIGSSPPEVQSQLRDVLRARGIAA
ncbi:MAG TPA: HEAT repeat domain-containing protein [Polyangiaceae bacterium]|nr:HEAT repeat domain-containing protein [Polyangiaceae bacterium]